MGLEMGLDPAACYVDTAGPTARGLQECSNACPAHAELMLYTSRDHVDHKPFSSAPTPTDNNTHNIKVIIIKWYYTPIPLTPPSFLGGVFCHVMSCHITAWWLGKNAIPSICLTCLMAIATSHREFCIATASMFWPLNATVPTENRDCLAAHNNKLVQTPHRFIFIALVSYLRVEQHGINNLSKN